MTIHRTPLALTLTGTLAAGLLALAATTPAQGTPAYTTPDLSHVVYIVGRRSTGFVLVQDTGVNVLHPPQRVALRQCDRTYGPNTTAASECRVNERATQALLVSLRDLA